MAESRRLTDRAEILGPPDILTDPADAGFDVLFPIGVGDRQQWMEDISHIYLTGVPRALRENGRVFLRQGTDIFWSAPVEEILSDSDRVSWITGEQHADGPSMLVDLERGEEHQIDARTLPAPDGASWHVRRGIKYVTPGCEAYVRVGPKPPKGAMRSRSSNEIALERALGKHLPVDRTARRIMLHDRLLRPIVEVDICIPELSLVVEYDGSYWHRNREAQDQRKTERLIAAGLRVIRVRDELPGLQAGESVSVDGSHTPDDIARLVLDAVNRSR